MEPEERLPAGPRINSSQEHELLYWSRTLGCSAQALREAIEAVGSSAERVAHFLNGRPGRRVTLPASNDSPEQMPGPARE